MSDNPRQPPPEMVANAKPPKPILVVSIQPSEEELKAFGLKIHDYFYDPRFPPQKGWRPQQCQPTPDSHKHRARALQKDDTEEAFPSQSSTTSKLESQPTEPVLDIVESQPQAGPSNPVAIALPGRKPLARHATEIIVDSTEQVPGPSNTVTTAGPGRKPLDRQATEIIVDTPPASPIAPHAWGMQFPAPQYSMRSSFMEGLPSAADPTSPLQAALLSARSSLKRGPSTNPLLPQRPVKTRKGKARESKLAASPRAPRYALRSHVVPDVPVVPSDRKRSLRNYVEGAFPAVRVQTSCPKRKGAVSDTPRARPAHTNEANARPAKRRRTTATRS